MIYQLRFYEIFEANRHVFHTRFRDHAQRLMLKHGFEIVFMWESHTERRIEFVYLLAWPDQTRMTTAWAEFMADDEWRRSSARRWPSTESWSGRSKVGCSCPRAIARRCREHPDAEPTGSLEAPTGPCGSPACA